MTNIAVGRLGLPALLVFLVPAITACLTDTITVDATVTQFAAVTAGARHACGLVPDGRAFCWTFGDGRPKEVSNGLTFQMIDTRADHTCGVATDGSAYCWGYNLTGQLGADTIAGYCLPPGSSFSISCSPKPIQVAGGHVFESVGVGANHSCGLTTLGTAYCWGSNLSGQLGAVTTIVCAPELVIDGIPCSPVPIPVDGGLVFQSLSVGSIHTCGIVSGGAAYCWGNASFGRLGYGGTDMQPAPMAVAGGLTFESLDAGGAHACGITSGGQLYCWGSNADLQIGTLATDFGAECGGSIYRCVLSPMSTHPQLQFTSVTASDGVLFAGSGSRVGGHTCGISQGDVFCWGLNESGQLYNSNSLRTAEPVKLDLNETFTEVSAGREHTCGLTTENRIICWAIGSPWSQWVVPAGV